MDHILEQAKRMSGEGNYLAIYTDGCGNVSVHVLSDKPDIGHQIVVDEKGNQIEPYGIVKDIEKAPAFIKECLDKRKAEKIREEIGKMGDAELIAIFSDKVPL